MSVLIYVKHNSTRNIKIKVYIFDDYPNAIREALCPLLEVSVHQNKQLHYRVNIMTVFRNPNPFHRHNWTMVDHYRPENIICRHYLSTLFVPAIACRRSVCRCLLPHHCRTISRFNNQLSSWNGAKENCWQEASVLIYLEGGMLRLMVVKLIHLHTT